MKKVNIYLNFVEGVTKSKTFHESLKIDVTNYRIFPKIVKFIKLSCEYHTPALVI